MDKLSVIIDSTADYPLVPDTQYLDEDDDWVTDFDDDSDDLDSFDLGAYAGALR